MQLIEERNRDGDNSMKNKNVNLIMFFATIGTVITIILFGIVLVHYFNSMQNNESIQLRLWSLNPQIDNFKTASDSSLQWYVSYGFNGEIIASETITTSDNGDENVPFNMNPNGYKLFYLTYVNGNGNGNACNVMYFSTKENFINLLKQDYPSGGFIGVELNYLPIYKISLDNSEATTFETNMIYEWSNCLYLDQGCNNTLYSITPPTKTGYEFDGYYTSDGTKVIKDNGYIDENFKESYKNKEHIFNSDVTLYASWIKEEEGGKYGTTYIIKHETNGGSAIDDKVINTGTGPLSWEVEIPVPTKENYLFEGWYKDADFSQKVTKYSELDKNPDTDSNNTVINVYANWIEKEDDGKYGTTYIIKHETNGGSTIDDKLINTGTGPLSWEVEIPVPTKENYLFEGWYKDADFSQKVTKYSELDKNPDTDANNTVIKVYAKWTEKEVENPEEKQYKITYNLNGGIVSRPNPSSYTAKAETFTLNNPTREGYKFIGWTGSNGSEPQINLSITKGSSGDKSYIANWEKIVNDQNPPEEDNDGRDENPTEDNDKKDEDSIGNNNSDKKENKPTEENSKINSISGKNDETTANSKLPKTGFEFSFLPVFIILLISMVVFYKKYYNLRNIK